MTGAELKAKRLALGLTQGELADIVRIRGRWGRRVINDYEAGRWPVPRYIIEGIEKL